MSVHSLTVVDWVLIVILTATAIGGLARGFFRSAFGLLGLVAGLVLAAWNYLTVAHVLDAVIHNEPAANTVAFIVIALVVMVASAIAGAILAKAIHKIGLGCLDRLAGALFGLFQGALLVTLVIWVTVAFFPEAAWLTQSRLPRYFFGACHLSTRVSPEQLAETMRTQLREIEARTPDWMHKDSNAR